MKYLAEFPKGKHDIPQSEVRALAPPGTHIWRGAKGLWAYHMPPHKRHQEPWSKYDMDSRAAMVACLRHAWQTFCAGKRIPISQCPIKGLF